jgi:hypothetical protein
MPDQELETLRQEIDRLLPAAMLRAVASYRAFALEPAEDPVPAKDFAAHHAACKAALNHLDALVRLARWTSASPVEAGAYEDNALADMVSEARRALTAYPAHPEDLA